MEDLKYTELLKLNNELAASVTGQVLKIKVLSNVTVNSFKDILEYYLRLHKLNPAIEIGNYDNIVQDSAEIADEDIYFVIYETLNIIDNVGSYFEDVSESFFEELVQKLKMEIALIFQNLRPVPLVFFNKFSNLFSVPNYANYSKGKELINVLNAYIEENKPANVILISTDEIIAHCGVKQAFDKRFYQSSKAPYSVAFLKEYSKAVLNPILQKAGKMKKAIIFDCDNTLWKGILGEDGSDGIEMSNNTKAGKEFYRVQEMAKFLSNKGVIVGLCSKNNIEDVDAVLTNHSDVVLKDDFIVIKKVNWEDKATNLRNIASELNIGLDSLVFVDDSDFEINLIRESIPEVSCLQVPSVGYVDALQTLVYQYFNLITTADDKRKTEMYKQQTLRDNARQGAGSIIDYLTSLQMHIQLSRNDREQIARVAQLTQKTNQFNLTTKRYTDAEIENYMLSGTHWVITLSANDKFGDNGITGVIIAKLDEEKNLATIDSLLMSCRIIGRNIEVAFVNLILEEFRKIGIATVSSKFTATAKNAQVNKFYEKLGFEELKEDNEDKLYKLDLESYVQQEIDYIKIEKNNF